ncbi:MAG: Flp family type IVb pilin [Desulfuromonadales bacterium]|nr:Flp family type IVb pilin [Desulfuromonadales bacterium]
MPLKFLERVVLFARDEEAATAVEYAIMLVLIVAVIIVTVGVLGDQTANSFNQFNNKFNPGS